MIRNCEICKQEIDPDRVEYLPETRLCTKHAQQAEKYGGEFTLTGTQSSLSKAGSLKKNYGDISVEKNRNTDALRQLREDYEKETH